MTNLIKGRLTRNIYTIYIVFVTLRAVYWYPYYKTQAWCMWEKQWATYMLKNINMIDFRLNNGKKPKKNSLCHQYTVQAVSRPEEKQHKNFAMYLPYKNAF